MKVRQLEGISSCKFLAAGLRRVERRLSGWLEEDMVDGWKKICWMIGVRSGGWLEEYLLDDWQKI